jgi:hypothetical protein
MACEKKEGGCCVTLFWILILLIVLYDLDRELDKYDLGG